MKIPLASSGLRQIDIEKAIEVLNSGKLTMGFHVKTFELAMARYLNCKEFIMMNSGSSANLSIIEALMRPTKSKAKLSQGDMVLVPAIAWPTTIWPLIQLGLKPLFVDVDPRNLSIDLEKAQKEINNHKGLVKGIFPIHPLGYAISPSKLELFAEKNSLVLINDVCESLGSWREGRHAGTSGIAGSFSFYFSHHITTMEGGGVATNDSEFADDLRSIRSHGWSRDRSDVGQWQEDTSSNDAKFLFVSTGFNVRPMEIQAAIGLSQIKDLDMFIEKRRKIASAVQNALIDTNLELIGGEALSSDLETKSHSWMLLALRVKGINSIELKKKIVEELELAGIETRPPLTGNFLSQPAMKRIESNSQNPEDFIEATRITNSTFLVGAHHDLTSEQIDFLCKELRRICKRNF